MIDFLQAEQIISQQTFSLAHETIPISEGLDRILAEDIVSPIDMPPFSKSAMDGYAVCPADDSTAFRVVEVIPAGTVPVRSLAKGECAKIMTGAMLPVGADRVVRREITQETDGWMRILQKEEKRHILQYGEDFVAGDIVLEKGTRLGPAQIAFLASIGVAAMPVSRRPRVGLVVTGTELIEPGNPLPMGKIYNSNRYSLATQVQSAGGILGAVCSAEDDPTAIDRAIRSILPDAEVIVLSGGVSEGDFDYVPQVLDHLGVSLLIRKIAMQPGRPTVFGRLGEQIFFGLPGNPVSAFLIFEWFIRPTLQRMMGHRLLPLWVKGTLAEPVHRKKSDRTQLLPVSLRHGAVHPLAYHGSAHLHALTSANAVLVMPPGQTEILVNETVDVRLL